MDQVLSELSTMTCVYMDGMAHSLIEVEKAVVHVISLISFQTNQISFVVFILFAL